MRKWVIILAPILIVVLSIVSGVATYYIQPPLPPNAPTLVAFSVANFLCYSTMAALIWMALQNFTSRLKFAFALFCGGAVLFAIAHAQVPLGIVLSLEDTLWMKKGGVLIPMLASIAAMYLGIQRTSKLFGIKSRWQSGWLVTLFCIGVGVVVALLPPGFDVTSEAETRAMCALIAICSAAFGACSMLTYRIKQHAATTSYSHALTWLHAIPFAFTFASGGTALLGLVFGNNHPIMTYGYGQIIEVMLTPLFLKAAYEFTFIDAPVQTYKGSTMLDIVMTAAAKVSNPAAIQTVMDRVRNVTAHTDRQALTDQDTAELTRVYHDIEQYLAKDEPVRRYTPRELRSRVARELQISEKGWA